MTKGQTLKFFIQRYTETNADGQLIMTDLINWGATTLSNQAGFINEEYCNKELKNLPITFQESEVNDERTPFEKMFDDAFHKLTVQVKRIYNIKTMIVTVGEMQESKIELLPKEGGFEGWDFRLDGPDYYSSKDKEWYPLGGGDEIEVSLNPFNFSHGCRVTCIVRKVVKRHNSYYKEFHDRKQLNRINKDFTCMAGHAIAYVKTEEVITGISKKGNPSSKAKVSFHDIPHWCYVPLDLCPKNILGNLEQKGIEFRIWIFPKTTGENQKTYFFSAHSIENFNKWDVVRSKSNESIIAVTGTICLLSSDDDKSILWISSEGGKFHNNGFKEDIRIGKEDFRNSNEVAQKWGKLIRDYLPLGFPAIFALDTESKTGKSKIKLRGLLPGLHGRMSSDQEARDH